MSNRRTEEMIDGLMDAIDLHFVQRTALANMSDNLARVKEAVSNALAASKASLERAKASGSQEQVEAATRDITRVADEAKGPLIDEIISGVQALEKRVAHEREVIREMLRTLAGQIAG